MRPMNSRQSLLRAGAAPLHPARRHASERLHLIHDELIFDVELRRFIWLRCVHMLADLWHAPDPANTHWELPPSDRVKRACWAAWR